MKTILLVFVLAGVPVFSAHRVKPQVGSSTTFSDQIVPLVIIGEGWNQRIVLANVDTNNRPSIGTLSFYTREGAPWLIELKDRGTASVFLVNLLAEQTAIYETVVKTYSQQLGWAMLSLQNTGLGDLFGQTIFRKQTPGRPDFMCSMALGSTAFSSMSVFFDNTEGRYTGMGILTSETCSFGCDTPVQLKVTMKTLDGVIISTKVIDQKKGVLYWMNLALDFPETTNRVGMFVVEPVTKYSAVLTGFSLQFAPNGAFTVVTPFEAL